MKKIKYFSIQLYRNEQIDIDVAILAIDIILNDYGLL